MSIGLAFQTHGNKHCLPLSSEGFEGFPGLVFPSFFNLESDSLSIKGWSLPRKGVLAHLDIIQSYLTNANLQENDIVVFVDVLPNRCWFRNHYLGLVVHVSRFRT